MTAAFLAIAITFFVGLMFLLFLFSRPSATATRLAQVTVSARTAEAASTEPGPAGMERAAGMVASVVLPIRKLLGMSEDLDLTRRFAMAGYRQPEYVDFYYAAKVLIPLVVVGAASFLLRGQSAAIFWFIAAAAVGFFVPDFWLTSAISRRRNAIRLALPDALDLLVICMEAGLALDQALIKVGDELKIAHPALSEEFQLISLEQRAGRPRIEAWRHMAERTELEVVRSFISMLVQTDRFGTPISKSLGTFADSLRTKRRQQAEEMAAKTTIKMIFPLVLFIFPSMFIVLLAPAIISIRKVLGEAFK
jgi:tight adherence protein C